MAIVRWDPFREMMSLQRDMNRLFDDISNQGSNRATSAAGMMPLAEMEDRNGQIHLKVEVPGMNADDLDIRVMKEAVVVSGERKTESTSEQNGQKRSEFRYGSFSRTIPLPEPVDNNNVQAEYKDGILTLNLPKMEDSFNKAVKVSLSGSDRNPEQIASADSSSSEDKNSTQQETQAA